MRSAKRSLAGRARELRRISSSPGVIGSFAKVRKLGSLAVGLTRQAPRGRFAATRAAGQKLLDDAILQRMKGHDREPSAGLQHALGPSEAASSSPSSSLTAMRRA